MKQNQATSSNRLQSPSDDGNRPLTTSLPGLILGILTSFILELIDLSLPPSHLYDLLTSHHSPFCTFPFILTTIPITIHSFIPVMLKLLL